MEKIQQLDRQFCLGFDCFFLRGLIGNELMGVLSYS